MLLIQDSLLHLDVNQCFIRVLICFSAYSLVYHSCELILNLTNPQESRMTCLKHVI